LEIDPSVELIMDKGNVLSSNDSAVPSGSGFIYEFKTKILASSFWKPSRDNCITLILVLGAVVCLLIPFFTNYKLVLYGTSEDTKIIGLVSAGTSVYLDEEVVGQVEKVNLDKKKAKLELERRLTLPNDSSFWIVAKEGSERITIKRGVDKKILRKGAEVKLEYKDEKTTEKENKGTFLNNMAGRVKNILGSRNERDVQKELTTDVEPKKDETFVKEGFWNSVDAVLRIIGTCTVFGGCIAAVFVFRSIKWLASIFKVGAVVSSLGIIRWIPDIVAFFNN